MTATMLAMHGKRATRALLGGALASLAFGGATMGQVVERHPAPLIFGAATPALTPAGLLNRHDDPTPFGVALNGITLVDARAHGAGRRSRCRNSTASPGPVAERAGIGSEPATRQFAHRHHSGISFQRGRSCTAWRYRHVHVGVCEVPQVSRAGACSN